MQARARTNGAVPILTLKSKVPHLEPPSNRAKHLADKVTQMRKLPEHSKNIIAGIKQARGDVDKEPVKKRRKRAQGPHPLSCLSKKNKQPEKKADGKKARKRRHKKNQPEDVTTLLKKLTSDS